MRSPMSAERRRELSELLEIADFLDSRGPVKAEWVRTALGDLLAEAEFWRNAVKITAETYEKCEDGFFCWFCGQIQQYTLERGHWVVHNPDCPWQLAQWDY